MNRAHYRSYADGLAGVPGIRLLPVDTGERRNFQYIVLEFDQRGTGVARDDMIRVLWAENVIARKYFFPGCHRMEPYRTLYPEAGRSLPHTEAVAAKLLVLPTGTGVSTADVDRICAILRLAVGQAPELRARLAKLPR